MVICLERGSDLHMAQMIPLPLTVSCFNKIQIGFTFLVSAHLSSPGQRAIKCACVLVSATSMLWFAHYLLVQLATSLFYYRETQNHIQHAVKALLKKYASLHLCRLYIQTI